MTRDDAKKILGEEATEEQVTNFLAKYHSVEKAKNEEINSLKAQLTQYSDYDELKKQLDDINKANMTEQQKLDQMLKEAEADRKLAKLEVSRAKAKSILADVNISDEQIEDLVSDNVDDTIAKATRWKETIANLKDTVAKETKESLVNLNLQPDLSNAPQGDDVMTIEKFNNLSAIEQEKFITEHPQEFENL